MTLVEKEKQPMLLVRKLRSRQYRTATLGTILGMAALSLLASCSDDDGDGDDGSRAGAPNGERAGAGGTSAGRGGRDGGAGTGGAPAPITGTGGEEEAGGTGGTGGEEEAGGTGGEEEAGGTGGEEEAGGAGGNGPPNVGGGGASGEGGVALGGAGAGGEAGNGAVCGDGTREPREECDDGGVEDNDGCSATCEIEYILDSRHIDLFELAYDDGLVLQAKDDTNLYAVSTRYREPERVIVNVDAARAAFTVPAGLPPTLAFLGAPGTVVYLLKESPPEEEKAVLPWPGWSTERLQATLPPEILAALPDEQSTDEKPVEFQIEEISGPGDVFAFNNNQVKFIDSSDDVPDRISASASAHVHVNWVFTAEGVYSLKVTPRLLQLGSDEVVGPQHEFRFHIGARLVAAESGPVLTVEPQQATYQVGQTVELRVSAEPEPVNPQYAWSRYHSSERVHEIFEERGDTLRFPATAPATGDGVTVMLASNRTGRRLVQSGSPLTIVE